MTVWNDDARTRRIAEVQWMGNLAVQLHLNERATGDPARDWLSAWGRPFFFGENLRVLVLGCGEGWLERAVAAWPFVARIDAVDVAAEAVARARAAAEAQGLRNITYAVVDLNRDGLARDAYDVVIAHSVLHHVERLEHALGEIAAALRESGVLLVNEYAGPKRFQYDPHVDGIINALLRCLPPELRRGRITPGVVERRERPTVEQMIASDPTEAVRSDELVPMIGERFEVMDRRDLGGTVLQHLLYDIAQNFRFDVPRERAAIELLCTIEGALVDGGRIGSDFVLLAARKRGPWPARRGQPPLPRPELARDVDRDPLGFGPRGAIERFGRTAGRRLAPWMLRALRVARLASRERRRSLIEETAWKAALEQARFLASGARPFEWLAARGGGDPLVRALLETADALFA